jgi:hypothetical protein
MDDAAAREKDANNAPNSIESTKELQRDPEDSPALDQDIDPSAVKTLPGTGGPDDEGDIEVDPDDLNLSGH